MITFGLHRAALSGARFGVRPGQPNATERQNPIMVCLNAHCRTMKRWQCEPFESGDAFEGTGVPTLEAYP